MSFGKLWVEMFSILSFAFVLHTCLNIALTGFLNSDLIQTLIQILTSYSCEITDYFSVLHLCMFDWFLTLIWLMFLVGNHLVETNVWCLFDWNRLPCFFLFAYECRLSKILNRTFQKASQGFVSIK